MAVCCNTYIYCFLLDNDEEQKTAGSSLFLTGQSCPSQELGALETLTCALDPVGLKR